MCVFVCVCVHLRSICKAWSIGTQSKHLACCSLLAAGCVSDHTVAMIVCIVIAGAAMPWVHRLVFYFPAAHGPCCALSTVGCFWMGAMYYLYCGA